MLKISYKTDKSFETITREIKAKEQELINAIMPLGAQTRDQMRGIIKQNKKRPQAGEPTRLEDAIDVENIVEGTLIGWGVGNIGKLDKEAPYYKAVNFGSSHIVGKEYYGFFYPGVEYPDKAAFRQGRFFEQKEFGFKMIPKKPIPAINFIEKTIHWLNGKINTISSSLGRR